MPGKYMFPNPHVAETPSEEKRRACHAFITFTDYYGMHMGEEAKGRMIDVIIDEWRKSSDIKDKAENDG